MRDAALCLFAWDLQDEGVDTVLRFAADSGLTTLFLASSYHAGWFILPHNPRRKCTMAEDGVVYFHPTESFYDSTPLKPKVARIAQQTDWLAEVSRRLDEFGLRLTPWTVCLHNTRLGSAHPEHCVQNALGDVYPHALCPASPAARQYVRGLAKDLATHYSLHSIFLEAPNYRGRRHGHHHERDGTPLGPLENQLLDISFSSHDLAQAKSAGIDAEAVRGLVRDHLQAYFASVPQRPAASPDTMDQFIQRNPSVSDYLATLDRQVESLIGQIKEDLQPYGVQLEGVEQVSAYDVLIAGAYGKPLDEVVRLTQQARQRAAPHQQIRVGFRLGFDQPHAPEAISSPQVARQYVQAAAEYGADSVFFYNYSESPRTYLSWIKPALAGMIQ